MEDLMYVVYQYGDAIHGIANTPEAALEEAREVDEDIKIEDSNDVLEEGKCYMLRCHEELYDNIEAGNDEVYVKDGIVYLKEE